MESDAGTKPADPAAAPTLEALQAEVVQLKAKAEENLDLARRSKAEFLNYQDRVLRDRQVARRQALEEFAREILPALDGFALAKFDDPGLVEALRLVEKEFLRVLAKYQITPIETAGRTFDPQFHDAVVMDPGGTQLEEVRRGWMMEGRVVRPAGVRIVKPPG